GLAPAAIVESRRDPYDALALRQINHSKKTRPISPAIVAARKTKGSVPKENEDPNFVKNSYQAIVMARDSLKQREEATKIQAEMQKLDNEVSAMKLKNEEEKVVIQDLKMALIKRKRKAEKCRRLAEAQSSYRTMLEKMIRDTMHQSVMYKEQVRLNQAASNALMARLEAQRAIC
ncbi:trichohyalin-like, partial [Trifolium medium]|nr:trichohyalin-like [Trifolium medium]